MDLSEAPVGASLRVGAVVCAPATRLRLAELGLRPGEQITVTHRTSGGGRVVSVDHCRIALDRATLRSVEVDVVDVWDGPSATANAPANG